MKQYILLPNVRKYEWDLINFVRSFYIHLVRLNLFSLFFVITSISNRTFFKQVFDYKNILTLLLFFFSSKYWMSKEVWAISHSYRKYLSNIKYLALHFRTANSGLKVNRLLFCYDNFSSFPKCRRILISAHEETFDFVRWQIIEFVISVFSSNLPQTSIWIMLYDIIEFIIRERPWCDQWNLFFKIDQSKWRESQDVNWISTMMITSGIFGYRPRANMIDLIKLKDSSISLAKSTFAYLTFAFFTSLVKY